MDSPRVSLHDLNSEEDMEDKISFKRLISANTLDSAVEAAASDEAMIFKSSEVPNTFSKWEVKRP